MKLIFKKYRVEIQNFFLSNFHFKLLVAFNDMCIYRVRLNKFSMTMSFIGIDADSRCDYRSNVDFVHFMWDNFERFSVSKITIILLPSDNKKPLFPHPFPIPILTKLVYLKYYRAFSENCWTDRKKNCDVMHSHKS